MRKLLRALYHLPDRLLHPVRRRRIEQRLRKVEPGDTILFVCLGNICRSPYAERELERLAGRVAGSLTATSAGFIRPGRPSPNLARDVANARGIDLEGHRSSLLTADILAEAELIFVMDAVQRRAIQRKTGRSDVFVLGDLDPVWSGRRTVRDPVDQPREVFEEVYDRITRCVKRIVKLASDPQKESQIVGKGVSS